MTERERDNRKPDEERRISEPNLADRLDRLSANEAEQVIRRALELTDAEHRQDEYGMLDRETLEVVARELGIPLKHLTKALNEQKLASAVDGDDTWFDRLLAIDTMDGATLVRGNIDAVYRALVTWFKSHEGLRSVVGNAAHGEWEKDSAPFTALRIGLGMTNSSRTLRSAGSVIHEIRSLSSEEHLVSIEAGKSRLRSTAFNLFFGAFLLSVITAIAVGAGPGTAGTGLLAGLWTALLFGTGAVAIVRSWSRRINRSIRRALDAITDPAGAGVFDTLPGRFGSFLESLGWKSSRR